MLEKSRSQAISQEVAFVGVGWSRQGLQPGVHRYALAAQAFTAALKDAQLKKEDIDGLVAWDGSYGGINPEQFCKLAGLAPQAHSAVVYGSGGYSVQQAAMMIASGLCTTVAVVYAQSPPATTTLADLSGDMVYDAAQGLVNPATGAAMGWTQHASRFGPYTEAALGHVAVAARRHARLNPEAIFRDDLTLDAYLADPVILEPFRSLDICKMTAGGYCVILTRAEMARDRPHTPVLIHAIARKPSVDPLGDPDHLMLPNMALVAEQLYEAAGCGPDDVDVLGISDGHTAVVLMTLERYGFCGLGDSEEFAAAGEISLGGKIPVNPDGGQLSATYSIGFMHQIELVRQLRGDCGDRQVDGAGVAQYTTTGNFRQEFLSNIYVRG